MDFQTCMYMLLLLFSCSVVKSQLVPGQVTDLCCPNRDNASSLYDCVREVSSLGSASKVTLVTFLSESVVNYGAFAVAINAVYAERNGYKLQVFGFPVTPKIEPDARWNKVRLLMEEVKLALWKRDRKGLLIVWLDADLVVLDLDMKIEQIMAALPDADIVMSKDVARSEFTSNSGFIIVRASDWSLAFLEKWWNTFDRRKCCDQNAFTWLYDELDEDNRKRVELLQPDAVNSNFPAWKHQADYNQVLHLAGASSQLFREPVFRRGFYEICRVQMPSFRNLTLLKPQLGLNRLFLVDHVKSLGRLRVDSLKTLLSELHADSLVSFTEEFARILRIKGAVEDTLKDDDDDARKLYVLEKNEVMEFETLHFEVRVLMFESFWQLVMRAKDESFDLDIALLEAEKESVSSAFEVSLVVQEFKVFVTLESFENYELLSQILKDKVPRLINLMESSLPASVSDRVLYYYRFKHAQLMATFLSRTSDEKLAWLIGAVGFWRDLVAANFFGTDYVMADPYREGGLALQELGTLLCSLKQYEKGIQTLKESVDLHDKTLSGYKNIRIAARTNIVAGKLSLVSTLVNLGVCGVEYGSSEGLEISISALERAQSFEPERDDFYKPLQTAGAYLALAKSAYGSVRTTKEPSVLLPLSFGQK